MEQKLTKLDIRKITPIAAMISAGKSYLLNVLLNMNFLESKDDITTKFIVIIRYNPELTEPRFLKISSFSWIAQPLKFTVKRTSFLKLKSSTKTMQIK